VPAQATAHLRGLEISHNFSGGHTASKHMVVMGVHPARHTAWLLVVGFSPKWSSHLWDSEHNIKEPQSLKAPNPMRSYEIPNIHFFRVNSVNLPKELHHFTPAAGFGAGTCQQPPVIEKSESWTPGSYGENIISTNLEILFYLSGDNYLWLLSHPSHVIL